MFFWVVGAHQVIMMLTSATNHRLVKGPGTTPLFLWREWCTNPSPSVVEPPNSNISWKKWGPFPFRTLKKKKNWIHIRSASFQNMCFFYHGELSNSPHCFTAPFLDHFLCVGPTQKNTQNIFPKAAEFTALRTWATQWAAVSTQPGAINVPVARFLGSKKVDIQIKRLKLTYKVGPGCNYKYMGKWGSNPSYKWSYNPCK